MKHFLLPVLCWTLAFSQTFAQNNPSQLHKNVDSIINGLLKKTGYEQSNASLPAHVQLLSNHLRLDSTKTFVDYTFPPADSTPLTRLRYGYPITGVRVETEDEFHFNTWVQTSRTTTTSDALGRIVNALGEVYDSLSLSWQPESSVQVFPHGNTLDLVDSIQAFSWDGVNWVNVFATKNTYNTQNRLLKNETTFDFGGGQSGLLVEEYTYDANGDNILIEKFLESSGFAFPTGRQELQYANHLVTQTIDYSFDGTGGFVATTRTTYAYNPAGLVTQQNDYQWVPGVNDWAPSQVIAYTYDGTGRLSTQENTTIQAGLPDEKVRLTYTYVEDENLATQSTYNWNTAQNVYVLNDRTYYYYSAGSSAVKPTPRPVQALVMSPNPTTDAVRFGFDEETRVQVFDACGQMLQNRVLQAGELLNLAALPAGIYQVMARTEAAFYAGKVVKF